jgi:hypothetical protein
MFDDCPFWFADNTSRGEDYWCALFVSRAFLHWKPWQSCWPEVPCELTIFTNLGIGSIVLRHHWIAVTGFMNFVLFVLEIWINNFLFDQMGISVYKPCSICCNMPPPSLYVSRTKKPGQIYVSGVHVFEFVSVVCSCSIVLHNKEHYRPNLTCV